MTKKTTRDKELKNTRVAEMIKLNERFLDDFTPREQVVMLRLLLMANDYGVVEVSTRALADMCEITRQNVRSVLTSLHEKGCVFLDVKQKTNPKDNPKGNPKSTFVTICNYDSYKVGRKKTTQNPTQKVTQNNDLNNIDNARTDKSIKRNALTSQTKREEYMHVFNDCAQDYRNFVMWLMNRAKHCFVNLAIPTPEEFTSLKLHSTGKDIAEMIEALENNRKYDNMYKTIYLTARNWLKRDNKWRE
jgi:hypothetical protein